MSTCRTESCCPPAMDYRADADVIPPVGCPTATVTIDPPDGSFVLLPTFVVLTCNVPGAAIYYTLDGSEPTVASNLYSGPFLFESLDETVKAVAIITGCDPGTVSTANYQQRTDSSLAFAYLCDSGDKVGAFGEFSANGQANDYQFVLQMTLLNNTEILGITILQTEADGVWDSGQSWATREYITPLGVPFHTYPLVLIDQAGPAQLFTSYQTTLGTIAAGTYEWRMWGQPFTTLNGYFMLLIDLADGTRVKRIIDTLCTDPPPPCEPPVFVALTVSPDHACAGDTVEVTWILSGTVPSGMTVDGEAVTPALSGSALVVLPSVPYSIEVTATNDCGSDSDSVVVAEKVCVLSEWSEWVTVVDWGTCEDDIQVKQERRTRTVITEPCEGGTPCGDLFEDRVLTRPCGPCTPPDDIISSPTCVGTSFSGGFMSLTSSPGAVIRYILYDPCPSGGEDPCGILLAGGGTVYATPIEYPPRLACWAIFAMAFSGDGLCHSGCFVCASD